MRVLVIGAHGFIGERICQALRREAVTVVEGVHRRRGGGADEIPVDLARDVAAEQWFERLTGLDAVVNAAGIFRETGGQRFQGLHEAGPRALFLACERAGVRKVVQISALGADASAASAFHRSKKRADDFLATLDLDWVVVQPSLVFGAAGASARLFARLACLPLIALPGDGRQRVQPVHVDDLAALVARLVIHDGCAGRKIPAVGPREITLREWLALLRLQLGMGSAPTVQVPLFVVRLAIGNEALGMLERGNTAPVAAMKECLGRGPRPVEDFVDPSERSGLALRARLDALLPLLRACVALVWVWSGVVSLGLYPVSESLALLARVGLVGAPALAALYGGALLDIALGAAIYLVHRRRWVWRAQIALMLAYSALIAVFLPELWLHPFGPLVKNVPLLAAILMLHELEERA